MRIDKVKYSTKGSRKGSQWDRRNGGGAETKRHVQIANVYYTGRFTNYSNPDSWQELVVGLWIAG